MRNMDFERIFALKTHELILTDWLSKQDIFEIFRSPVKPRASTVFSFPVSVVSIARGGKNVLNTCGN